MTIPETKPWWHLDTLDVILMVGFGVVIGLVFGFPHGTGWVGYPAGIIGGMYAIHLVKNALA